MADSNDELLEDGDLSETNFDELDLAEEDALLADDDEKPPRIDGNIEGGTLQEDDDYLELGLDEDILMHDEEVFENGNSARKRMEMDFNYNDDSDDNSGGERSRFKSERQISAIPLTRNTSTIPETLDAVALPNPVKSTPAGYNRGSYNRGGGKAGGGRGGGSGYQWSQYRSFGRNPNIHVNPHFRPRLPMGGPLVWNGFQGGPPHPPLPPPYHPPFGGGFSPIQPPQWNDQGYFSGLTGHPPFNSSMDNDYYRAQDDFYQNQQNFHHQTPLPPQPQMGWGDDFYPGPHNFPPHHNFQPSPGPMMGPPRMRPPFNAGPRPPFLRQNKPFQVKSQPNLGTQNKLGTNLVPLKREQFFSQSKVPPVKQQKLDSSANRVRSNLQEVQVVDSLPPEVILEEEDEEMKAYRKKIEEQKKLREKVLKEKEEKRLVAAQQKASARLGLKVGAQVSPVAVTPVTPAKPSNDGPPGVIDVDGPEFKTVRLRKADGKTVIRKLPISEIKKLKKVPVEKKVTPPSSSVVPTTPIKKVKKVPLAVKAAPPPLPPGVGKPSRVVAVENLSASTSQKQLEVLAVQIGSVQKVELDCNKNTAIIKFLDIESAQNFVTKYQRKMVDLSMIGVRFVKE